MAMFSCLFAAYSGLNHGTELELKWLICHSFNTYKSGRLPAVPWLYIQRHFEQVVRKLLLTPGAHRVQVLEEPLYNETKRHVLSWGSMGGSGDSFPRENAANKCSPWFRAPPSDSRAGSDTAGSLLWFRPLSSSCWSWLAPCRGVWGSLGCPPPSSGCWLNRYLRMSMREGLKCAQEDLEILADVVINKGMTPEIPVNSTFFCCLGDLQ